MKYILGVDGGNTKCDYYLMDVQGNFIDKIKAKTCSNQRMDNGFIGTKKEMEKQISTLFLKNNINVNDIEYAVFGLAGCDTTDDKDQLNKIVSSIGFKNYLVVNDSTLPIKAGTTNGIGVCSINGTCTSSNGIDSKSMLQVGGLEDLTQDEAGGIYIARKVIQVAYNELMRFGPKTILTKSVIDKYHIDNKLSFIEKVGMQYNEKDYTSLVIDCFKASEKDDKVAKDILINCGIQLAKTASSTILNLDFGKDVEVVMAGSVFVKQEKSILNKVFKEKVLEYTKKNVTFILLKVPPVTGALIWASELIGKKELKNKIIDNIRRQK